MLRVPLGGKHHHHHKPLLRRVVRVLPLLCLAGVVLLLLRSTSSFASTLARTHGGRRELPELEGVELPVVRPSECGAEVSAWARSASAIDAARAAGPAMVPDLTYFLHVPRTAGRTLFFCALKPAFSTTERCERAYDELRVDPAKPGCSLLSSHDDHRLVDAFPGPVTVVTQLRPPLDRLLSAYEFAVEVAARGAFGARDAAKRAGNVKPGRTETTDVWPWSVLVPMLTADIDARAAARNGNRPPVGHPYDNGHVMSLVEFVAHPAVAETLHNGAAYQLLGLTNNTREGDEAHGRVAARVRACARAGGAPAAVLRTFAETRLRDHVQVVTLKQRLAESVSLLAASLQRPLSGKAWRAQSEAKEGEQRKRVVGDPAGAAAVDADTVDIDVLGVAYARCAARQRDRMASRRGKALAKLVYEDGTSLSFNRSLVTPEMAAAIDKANWMDVVLLELGTQLFESRKAEHIAAGTWEELASFEAQLI